MRFFAALLCLLFAGVAHAAPLTDPWQPINPNGGAVTLAVTTTSAQATLVRSPIVGASPAPQAWVCNIGGVGAFVAFGNDPTKPLVATTTQGFPIKAGACSLLDTFQQTFVAGITATGSTTLSIASGSGNPIGPLASDVGPWKPVLGTGSTTTITATTSSHAVPLTTNAASLVYLCNLGNNDGYVVLADAANHAVATVANGFLAQGGQCYFLNSLNLPYLAAITASGSTTITASSGNGSPVSPIATLPGTGTVVSITFTGGLTATQNPATTISTASLDSIANNTVMGNVSGILAVPSALNQAQLTALVNPFTSVLPGDVPASGGGTTNFLRADGTWAAPAGSGTVTSITFTGDGTVLSSTPSAPVTTTGTLTAALKTQTANTVLAGPTSGPAANPTFRALVGADLPNPSFTTLGGVEAISVTIHQWVDSISLIGAPHSSQPACGDLSNAGTGCTAGAATTTTAGISKLHYVPVAIGWIAGVNPNNATVAIINQASTISALIGDVETPTGASATLSVNIAPSGTACSAGTTIHSGSFNANGTAATNQTLTLTTTAIPAGDRLCIQTTGTWTSGVGGITVFLAPS